MHKLPEHKNRKEIPEYNIWKAMRARCSTGCKSNQTYKEKNILVCEEWNDFKAFYRDMGARPSSKHSIDRINNNEGYSKDNCRWTTQKTQCENRGSFNLVFIHNGEPKVLKQIASEENIKYTTLYKRIKDGMTLEEALNTIHRYKSHKINGKDLSLVEICEKLNLSYSAVYTYKKRHKELSIEEVLNYYNKSIEDIV